MRPILPPLETFGLHSRMSALFWHTSSKNDDMHMIRYDLTTRSTDFATHIPHRAFTPSCSDYLIRPKSCLQHGQEYRPCQHFSHLCNDRPTQSVMPFAYPSKIQHSHHQHQPTAPIYHQTLTPLSLPIPGFHLLWVFERNSSAQPKNGVSGGQHPRPFGCNEHRSRKSSSKFFTLETGLDHRAHDCRPDLPEPPVSLTEDKKNCVRLAE
jgi:hypothetical protein